MRTLCAYEIVTSIVRGSHHYIPCGQRLECAFENRTRQMWTVTVKGDDTSVMTFGKVGKYRSKSRSETLTFLRNYACWVACQLREFVYIRVRAHDGNFHIAQ